MGSKTKTNTWVTTNTTTNIRDIGLTGAAAVDAIGLIEGGSIEREQLRLEGFKELTNNLSIITDAAGKTAETQLDSVSKILGTAERTAKDIVATQSGELQKVLPFILLAVVGIAAIPVFVRR